MVTVYVLEGANGKRYVGITKDLSRRLREHRAHGTKGSQVLGARFRVIHTEEFADHAAAREREKYLKSGAGREWLARRVGRSGPASGG